MHDYTQVYASKPSFLDFYRSRPCHYLLPSSLSPSTETPLATIEEAFKDFTNREDISVLLINQSIASTIRHLLDGYTRPVPAILEVPSKDQPYDPTQDSILARVKFMFGEG
jgi:ATP synthase F subunit